MIIHESTKNNNRTVFQNNAKKQEKNLESAKNNVVLYNTSITEMHSRMKHKQ